MTPEELRSRFPALAGRVYLNAAAEGAMPADAILEAERVARLKATPWEIGADLYYHAPAAVRALLERMLGAPGGTVAIVAGTSAGIGIAARGLPLGSGHEVLLLEYQFPSNAWPWRAVEARGATVRVAPRPLGSDPTAAILRAIGPATRVVAIDWVNYVDGAVVDLCAVGAACRQRGIWFVVDAAQGLGALTVDVTAAGIDLLAAPSHKWLLGPIGLGLVYVRPELIALLQPWNAGWLNLAARAGMRNLLKLDGTPPGDATRFETGAPAPTVVAPWRVSLELLAEAGPAVVEKGVLSLAARAREGLLALEPAGLALVSPREGALPSGILSFRAGDRSAALSRTLQGAGITVALREGAIRISPHLYNTGEDVETLLAAVGRFLLP